MSQHDAVIVGAVRTPVGVGKPGKALSGVHPGDLSAHVLSGLVARTGVDPALVDDVIWGCVSQVGEQGVNIGRNAALAAGFPESVPGTTVDRQCGSSQQAVHFAAAGLVAGHYDVVVAGGVESMSRVPMFSNMVGGDGPFPPRMLERYDNGLVGQGISAEMIAEKWGLSRTQLDEIAVRSHERAAAATDSGHFAEEILPVGDVTADEGIRRGTTLETLAGLRPAFREDGVVTAGNASQISDGSAALLLTTSAKAAELGLTPMARIHTVALAGVDPVIMLTGPIPATAKVLARSGLALSDIGAFEVNEAFASVIGAWLADTGADPDLLNPNGGAIALGHPLGASGARLMTTLVHHMRRGGIRYGLQTMCEGGGMANATILELL
ncbi:MAG: thiolase family protein [Actinomycetales bacterium]|nr:thiolase family protein [Actinomycetales bacterium]